METEEESPQDVTSYIVGAVVVSTTISGFEEIKKAAAKNGRIVFQKIAPPWNRLIIVERGTREG